MNQKQLAAQKLAITRAIAEKKENIQAAKEIPNYQPLFKELHKQNPLTNRY
jgi:hypothetical protein